MSDILLIEHCAPTLARIKTANLFSCSCGDARTLLCFLILWNKNLNSKDVYVRLMKKQGDRALIYVYRKSRLAEDLRNFRTRKYLQGFGYSEKDFEDLEQVLKKLRKRICTEKEFPHEIGFFLGYPPEDVVGFIENNGKNFKLCGCWKVYSDVREAERRFNMYKKCRDVYKKVFECGKTLDMLTVPLRA